jgi:hypothetical protein
MPEAEVVQAATAKTLADMKPFERRQYFMQKNAEEAQHNREMKGKVEQAIIDALYDAEDPERVEWRPVIKVLDQKYKTGNVSTVWNDMWNTGKIESVDGGATPSFYRLSSKIMRQTQRERSSKTKK